MNTSIVLNASIFLAGIILFVLVLLFLVWFRRRRTDQKQDRKVEKLRLIAQLIKKELLDNIIESEESLESKFPSVKFKLKDKSTLTVCYSSSSGKYEIGQYNAWLAERSTSTADLEVITSTLKDWIEKPLPGFD